MIVLHHITTGCSRDSLKTSQSELGELLDDLVSELRGILDPGTEPNLLDSWSHLGVGVQAIPNELKTSEVAEISNSVLSEEAQEVVVADRSVAVVLVGGSTKGHALEHDCEDADPKVEHVNWAWLVEHLRTTIDSSYFWSQVLLGTSPKAKSLLEVVSMSEVDQGERPVVADHNVVWLEIEVSQTIDIVELYQ